MPLRLASLTLGVAPPNPREKLSPLRVASRASIQQRLERGATPNFATAMLAAGWGAFANVTSSLRSSRPLVCIGGSTLGGSGRTPLTIACARFLARRSKTRVTVIAHGYRASPPAHARVVTVDDDPAIVGDEAIECARALEDVGARVVVATQRQRAIDFAESSTDILIIDGVVQTSPPRATLALLAVDAASPFGSNAHPPLGNLRAPRSVLLAATDHVVTIGAAGDARPQSRGAWLDDELVSWDELRSRKLGLITAIARPDRVVAFLQSRNITPTSIITAADHDVIGHGQNPSLTWLTTAKDAARQRIVPTPAIIDYYLDLPAWLTDQLSSRF